MMQSLRTLLALLAAGVLCAGAAFSAHTNFRATLTGTQEVPPVTTTASGTGAFTMTGTGGLVYSITVTGLSGPITGAHFHLGAAGIAGPVVQGITFSGTTATGTWSGIPDSLVQALLEGRIYVNIHTAANPGGEIRGQVVMASGTALAATLEGSQENPAVTTSAKGTASVSLSSVGGVGLVYALTVNGLSGPITGAHFHRGVVGTNGPVVKDITPSFVGNTAVGVWRSTGTGALTDSLILDLLTGGLYLNVHTAANPGGEIRGQLNVSASIGLEARLDASQEVPPGTSPAKGTGSFALTEYGMVFNITVDGLSGSITGAHFHNAAAGVNGPVVRTLTFSNNTTSGVWRSNDAEPLNASLLRELLAGNIYVNIHTAANPGGEIRGQVLLKNGSGATARFDGRSEIPPIINTAKATGSVVATSTGATYAITVTGLSGAITGAHFHRGAIGTNGPVVKDITSSFAGTTASGTWGTTDPTQPFTDSLRAALVAGQLYLNIHTATNPGGETRGQVLIDAGTGFKANLTSQQENPPLTNSAKGTGSFTLTRGGLAYAVSVADLSGPITGAHFHLGPPGQNGPVVFDLGSTVSGNNITGYWRSPADSLLLALLTGRLYVNVHTSANPGGEIRGQLLPSEGTGLAAQLSGAQEVPPVASTGRGSLAAIFTDGGLTFHSTIDGLSASFTAAHFHNAAAGTNGPVVRTLTANFSGNTASGVWRSSDTEPFSNSLIRELLANNIYINVHTPTFPGGEVRGQLRTGSLIVTSVSPISSMVPEQFELAQNYPNPFNPVTTIRIRVPSAGKVRVAVFNILGSEVVTLVNENLQAGSYDIQWDASNLPSGTYFYRMTAEHFSHTRKMTLIK